MKYTWDANGNSGLSSLHIEQSNGCLGRSGKRTVALNLRVPNSSKHQPSPADPVP